MSYNPNTANVPDAVLANARTGTNSSGITLQKATPVKFEAGGVVQIDPSIEADVDGFAGLTKENVINGANVDVVTSGTIEGITTLANVGDSMYVSKSGSISNVKPSIGMAGFVAGDWIIRVGVVAKNQLNPLLKDLIVNIQFVGQL